MKSIVLYQDGEFAIKLGIRVIRVDVEKIRKNGRRSSLSKTKQIDNRYFFIITRCCGANPKWNIGPRARRGRMKSRNTLKANHLPCLETTYSTL